MLRARTDSAGARFARNILRAMVGRLVAKRRAVQAELKALVARTAPGVPVDSDVYAARHRAQLQEQRISDIMAHVQGIERALS